MARVRSPNYPAIGLPAAIERIEKLHQLQHQTPEEREVVAQHLGYSGLNGKSLKVMSALMKFGLLERVQDGRLRITDLAINIVFPEDEDRGPAVREAAFSPSLFSEIRKRWPDHVPTDESLRAYLIRRQFSQSAIEDVIRNYRQTINLVTQESVEYDSSAQSSEDQEVSPQQTTEVTPTSAPLPTLPSQGPPFQAGFDGSVLAGAFRLTTPEEIDTLVRFLEINKVMITPVSRAFDTGDMEEDNG